MRLFMEYLISGAYKSNATPASRHRQDESIPCRAKSTCAVRPLHLLSCSRWTPFDTVPLHAPAAGFTLNGDTMPISKELLEILVCPVCKAPVKLLADGSGLKCGGCRRVYPVRDDIPVMLPEEAKIAQE